MRKHILTLIVGLTALTITQMGSIHAQGQMMSQARVVELQGNAEFMKSGSEKWMPLAKGAVLSEGDRLKTALDSEVRLELSGNAKTAEIVVRQNSDFIFKTFRHDEPAKIDNTLLDVQIGSVLVKAEKLVGDSKFEVKTPTSIVGIRGTTFEVNVSQS